MLNIKETIKNIKTDNKLPGELEIKCLSLKLLYGDLKKSGDLRNMIRLRYLLYYYPTLIEKNAFKQIERCINDPSNTMLTITRERPWFYEHEKYAIEKCDCNFGIDKRNFYVEDFFKFYKI